MFKFGNHAPPPPFGHAQNGHAHICQYDYYSY